MSHITDWREGLIFPLQHHDKAFSYEDRRSLAGVRIHEPGEQNKTTNENSEAFGKDTYGDILGGLLARANPGDRNDVHAWWLTGAPFVYDGPAAAGQGGGELPSDEKPTTVNPGSPAPSTSTDTGGTSTRTRPQTTTGETTTGTGDSTRTRDGASTNVAEGNTDVWRPITEKNSPDALFMGLSLSHPLLEDQVYPKGWTGTVSAGTDIYEQKEVLHPDFLGLVAPQRAGNPKAGTPVFDLLPDGSLDTENYARLQSLVSVEDVTGGKCGVGGKVLALQLGAERLELNSGHLMTVTHTAQGKVLAPMGNTAGGPLYHGGAGGDQHSLGTAADGSTIVSGHLSTNALFKGGLGDGPLGFEWGIYPEVDNYPHKAPVHLVWDPATPHQWCGGIRSGVWRAWAEVPLFSDEGGEKIDIFIPSPINLVDPVDPSEPTRPRTGDDGIGTTRERTPIVGGTGQVSPTYVASTNCLIAGGGLAYRAYSTRKGEPDLTGAKTVSPDMRKLSQVAPIAAVYHPFAAGDGSWGGWSYATNRSVEGFATGQGGTQLLPPGVPLSDALNESASSDLCAMNACYPGLSCFAIGSIDPTTGMVYNGFTIEVPSIGGDLTFYKYEGGVNTGSKTYTDIGSGGGGWTESSGTTSTTNDVDIDGKLTVSGGIDPTYLQLTPQVSVPYTVASTLWTPTSDNTPHWHNGTSDYEILTTNSGASLTAANVFAPTSGNNSFNVTTASASSMSTVLDLIRNTSGTATDGLGGRIMFSIEDALGSDTNVGYLSWDWSDESASQVGLDLLTASGWGLSIDETAGTWTIKDSSNQEKVGFDGTNLYLASTGALGATISGTFTFDSGSVSGADLQGALWKMRGDPLDNLYHSWQIYDAGAVAYEEVFRIEFPSQSPVTDQDVIFYGRADDALTEFMRYDASEYGVLLSSENSGTNTVLDPLTIRRTTTGTAAAGLGAGVSFELEDAAGTVLEVSRIDVDLDDATAGSVNASMAFSTIYNGSMTEFMRLDGNSTGGASVEFALSALPSTDSVRNLGAIGQRWNDLFLGGALKDGTNVFSLPSTTGTLALQSAILTDLEAITGNKGDILVYDGSDWVDLAVGSNDQVLTADSAQTTGLKWAAASSGVTTFHGMPSCTRTETDATPISEISHGGVSAVTDTIWSGGIGLVKMAPDLGFNAFSTNKFETRATGEYTSYVEWRATADDESVSGSAEFVLVVPNGMTGWDTNAIRWRHKVAVNTGGITITFTLRVYNPATNASLVTSTRATSSTDTDYQWLTITSTQLSTTFSAGDMLRVALEITSTTGAGNDVEVRFGEIKVTPT